MLAHSTTAIVARNDVWAGASASEPYECGWAREAIVWIRAMDAAEGDLRGVRARVQISPDGIRWLDEGGALALPTAEGEVTFTRVREFGNWLRVAADLPNLTSLKVLVTITAKG
jgi:hypothetical protein